MNYLATIDPHDGTSLLYGVPVYLQAYDRIKLYCSVRGRIILGAA